MSRHDKRYRSEAMSPLAPTWGSRGALLDGQFLLLGGYAPAAKSYQDSILAWNPVLQVTFIFSFVLFSCPSKV